MTVTVRHGELAWGHRGQAVEAPRLDDRVSVACLFLRGEEFLPPQRQARSLLLLLGQLLLHDGGQHGVLLAATVARHRL